MQLRVNLAPGKPKTASTTMATLLRAHDRRAITRGILGLASLWLLWYAHGLGALRRALLISIGVWCAFEIMSMGWRTLRRRTRGTREILQMYDARGKAFPPEIVAALNRLQNPPLDQAFSELGTAIRLGRRVGILRRPEDSRN